MKSCGEVVSLTFGDQGENHVGMETVGSMVDEGLGFNIDDFKSYRATFKTAGYMVEIYHLNRLVSPPRDDSEEAYVMVVRNGAHFFLAQHDKTDTDLLHEMNSFDWDRQYYCTRRSKVLNKHARANVCFGHDNRAPDYENKKGRIVAYDDVPSLKIIKEGMETLLGPKCTNLICEGNRYFDLKKCGIGWHGDAERRKVVAFRLGEDMDLHFNWFERHKPFGETLKLTLNSGDMYFMSEKAVGWDWKKSSKTTLRHSAGKRGSSFICQKRFTKKRKKRVSVEG